MIAKMKQRQPKSTITGKDKSKPATLAISIEDIECWKYHKKGYL